MYKCKPAQYTASVNRLELFSYLITSAEDGLFFCINNDSDIDTVDSEKCVFPFKEKTENNNGKCYNNNNYY